MLPRNDFFRGVSVLVGGTVGAQALVVFASPFLTRMYTPEDFGLLAVYVSILSLFIVIASLRYELAIPLPEQEEEAAHLVVLSLIIVFLITGLSSLLIMAWGKNLAELINAPAIAEYFWFIPLGVFVVGCFQVFSYWAIRTKKFGAIAKTKIAQSLTMIIVQLFGYKLGVLALILGQAGGQTVGVITLARSTVKNPYFRRWQWLSIKEVAVRYRDFPIFSTWGGFLNAASMQLPPLLFAIFFSAGMAGLYALAHRVLAIPMSVIGSAVGSVFFANAAEAYRDDKLAPLFESVYAKLVTIIMPVMLLLLIDAPSLFALVFGEDWKEAGEMARWMAPWLAIVFIVSPLSTLIDIFGKQKEGMYFQSLMLTVRVLAIAIGYRFESMNLSIILFSIFSLLCWGGFLVWVARKSKSNTGKLLAPVIRVFLKALFCITPLLVISMLEPNKLYWYGAMVLTVIFMLIYYVVLFREALTAKVNTGTKFIL